MWSWILPEVCIGCGGLLAAGSIPALCKACGATVRPLAPADRTRDDISACFAFEGPLAQALRRLKYRGQAALAGPLGAALATSSEWDRPWDAVVPVPLHWRRRIARGYDHASLLARAAIRRLDRPPPLEPRLLARVRATPPQAARAAALRRGNVAGAFAVRQPSRVQGRRILLVDDVTTTGATMAACRECLLAAGATRVGALALLRTLA